MRVLFFILVTFFIHKTVMAGPCILDQSGGLNFKCIKDLEVTVTFCSFTLTASQANRINGDDIDVRIETFNVGNGNPISDEPYVDRPLDPDERFICIYSQSAKDARILLDDAEKAARDSARPTREVRLQECVQRTKSAMTADEMRVCIGAVVREILSDKVSVGDL